MGLQIEGGSDLKRVILPADQNSGTDYIYRLQIETAKLSSRTQVSNDAKTITLENGLPGFEGFALESTDGTRRLLLFKFPHGGVKPLVAIEIPPDGLPVLLRRYNKSTYEFEPSIAQSLPAENVTIRR